MEELKRVFFSKKYILILLLLIVINGWVVWKEQQPDVQIKAYYEENYEGNYIRDENCKYKELLKKYQQMDIQTAVLDIEAYFEEFWKNEDLKLSEQSESGTITKKDVEISAISEIYEQIAYINGYQDDIENIKESAQEMKQLSMFAKKESFSVRNIDKTVKDYGKLKNLKLTLDNERAVNAFVNSTFTGLLLMIMAAVVVLIFLEERKKGLWQFIYSMPRGRHYLSCIRCITMFLAVSFSGILLECETLLITGSYYGGLGDLGRTVQSNINFSGCVLEISMGMYLFLTIFMKIIVCTFFGIVFWGAVSSIKTHTGVFAVLAFMLAGEYYFYNQIGKNSVFNQWKYINIFAFLDTGHTLTTYQNVNLFGYPVGIGTLLLYVLPVLLLALCVVVVLLGKQRPFLLNQNIIVNIYEKIVFKIKPYRRYSLFLHECYKVFVKQKCAYILIILILLCVNFRQSKDIFFDYGTTIYNNYMKQIEGVLTENKIEYLKAEKAIWTEKVEQSKEKTKKYQKLLEESAIDNNKKYLEIFSSYEKYQQELKKIQNYEIANNVVIQLLEDAQRLNGLQKEGMNAGFVNKIGYDMYIGKHSYSASLSEALLMLAFLTVTLSGISSYESSHNAEKFIRSTKKGRNILMKKKSMIVAIISLFIFLPVTIMGFYNIFAVYGIGVFDICVQSLEMFAGFEFNLSLGAVLLCIWVIRYLMLFSVGRIIMFLSGKAKNMMISFVICALMILAPAGIVYMGFSIVSFFSVVRPVTVTYFWNQYGFDGIMWWLPCFLVFVIGILCKHFMDKNKL